MGWPRPGDLGVLAVDEQRPVGAAWLRLLPESDPGYGFVDAATPELSMGVVQAWRKRGVGRRLLDALVAAAREQGLASLSLSVEVDNYARRLYERVGFRQVGEVNGSVTMLLRLDVPSDRRPEKRPGAPEQVNRRDHSRTSRAANSSLESHDGLDM